MFSLGFKSDVNKDFRNNFRETLIQFSKTTSKKEKRVFDSQTRRILSHNCLIIILSIASSFVSKNEEKKLG